VQDGSGKFADGSTTVHEDFLHQHMCSEFPVGTYLQVKYNPDQLSQVDVVDSRLVVQSFVDSALLYSVPLCTTLFVVICAGFELWGLLLFFQKRIRWRLLRARGMTRDGEVVSYEARAIHRPMGYVRAVVRYKFLTPEGIELFGQQAAICEEFDGQALPIPGTPLTVLYVNQRVHHVL
jgi:hypothetical protein